MEHRTAAGRDQGTTAAGSDAAAGLPPGPGQQGEVPDTPVDQGLTGDQAAALAAAGQANAVPGRTGRSLGQILRANVLTRFNAILGSLLVVIAVVGPVQDGLFGVVLVVNTSLGIIQELRARRVLDRLAVLTAPRATVVRDGVPRDIPLEAVVRGDVVALAPGNQAVVDGVVVRSRGLEMDESLVTGEAEPVVRGQGEEILSGSFVVSGNGRMVAVRVGADAYAQRLQVGARRFSLVQSELQQGTNWLLRAVTWVMVPAAALLVTSQLLRTDQSLAEALRATVAGVSIMVPEGLVLLTTIAFAVGAVRLAGRRVLVQELAAIEGLARVDVLCIDKTGTLTEPGMAVARVAPLAAAGGTDVTAVLGAVTRADPAPNATAAAIARHCPDTTGWAADATVPFSSARKWSAAAFPGHGTWVLGAPDILFPGGAGDDGVLAAEAGAGRRVLLLARTGAPVSADTPLPADLVPVGMVALEEHLRPQVVDTVRYLSDQGITIKVLSGDAPATVGAVARRVGIPPSGDPVDARTLPDGGEELARAVEAAGVFGRVQPEQKRSVVQALQQRGHVVAMTGDGVNDVPSLKQADLGVAMGSGSQASRSVARLVLLDSSFAAVPMVLGEGRRVIANIERVANLFVTKTVYAALLAVVVGSVGLAYPFYPRHMTLISTFAIGIPGFFLALAAGAPRSHAGFTGRVLRFTLPVGTATAAVTLAAYGVARAYPGAGLAEARTVATVTLAGMSLWVLLLVARPLDGWRLSLVGAMAGGVVVAFAIPWVRQVLALSLPPAPLMVIAVILVAAGAVLSLVGLALVPRLLPAAHGPAPGTGPDRRPLRPGPTRTPTGWPPGGDPTGRPGPARRASGGSSG